MVVGPGAAMDPRVPQNLTCMLSPLAPFPPAPQLRATGSPWLLATGCESTTRRALPPYEAMIELYIPLNHARPGTSGRVGRQRAPTCRVTSEMLTHD